MHVNEIDLRPWTFISPDHIISTRVDRAALTIDAVRQRLQRDPAAGMATVSASPARFGRSEIKDPAAAIGTIARRGIGTGGGVRGEPAGGTDMTPFFRRDPQLPNAIRQRIVRSGTVVPPSSRGYAAPPEMPTPSGVPSPGTPGTLEGRVPARGDRDPNEGRIDRGTTGGTPVPTPGGTTGGTRVPGRRTEPQVQPQPQPQPQVVPPPKSGTTPNWRDRIQRPVTPPPDRPTVDRGTTPTTPPPDESWRGRTTGRRGTTRTPPPPQSEVVPRNNNGQPVERLVPERPSDIPRRIIDRIGGARIYGEPRAVPRESAPPPRESAPPPPPRVERSSPPPSHSSSSSHSSGRAGGGGRVKH
ncbi:MAG TPA: hypothetical protein VKH35_05515 [Thermoanaerobaculia bacterium]|nr:hypothetical protein [Thermoanaerobaculia bacterium]